MTGTIPAPRSRSTLGRVLRGLGAACLFTVATLGGALLHANTPAVRGGLTSLTNRLLADVFYGELRLDGIGALSRHTITLDTVHLYDEQGERVLVLQDAHVELDALRLVYDILFGGQKLDIVLSHARVEAANVKLIPQPDTGEPTLSKALTPRPTERVSKKERRQPRYVRVYLPIVELGTVRGEIDLEGLENVLATLANVHGRVLFSPKGIAVDVDRFGTSVSGILGIDVRGSGSFSLRAPGPLQLDFSGFADEAEVQARVGLHNGTIDASATVPRLLPSTMKKWIAAWPIRQPVSARVTAKGKLPELQTDARFSLGEARIGVHGPVDISERVSARLEADLQDVDLQTLFDGAPAGRIHARTTINVDAKGNDYRVELDGKTEATTIEGIDVPATKFTLAAVPDSLSGDVSLFEPGGTIHAKATYNDGKLDAKASVPELQLLNHRRLPRNLRGVSALNANVELQGQRLVASAKGRVTGFGTGELSIAKAEFDASVEANIGEMTEAGFVASVDGSQIRAGRLEFDSGRVTARGNRHRVDIDASFTSAGDRHIAAKGSLHADLSVTNAHLEIERGAVRAEADVARFDWDKRIFDIPHVSVQGREGRLEGHVLIQPGLAEGALSAQNLNVAKVASRLAGAAVPIEGKVDLETEFAIGGDLQRGHLQASIADFSVERWANSDATLLFELEGRHLTGAIIGRDELGFSVDGKWNVLLAGHPLELESFTDATGTAELSILGVPMGPIALALNNEVIPELEGKLGVRALLQRTEPQGFPNAFVEVGASVERARVATDGEPLVLSNISTYFSAGLDAQGKKVNGAGSINDMQGGLVNLTTAFDLDPQAWWSDPNAALREFRSSPISVVANLPSRDIADLPLLDLKDVGGRLEAQVALFGSIVDPRLSVLADARNVVASGIAADAPVAVNLSGNYAPTTGDIDVKVVGSSLGRSMLLARVQGSAPWQTAATGKNWSLSARAGIDRLPLQVFAPLVEQELAGTVSGHISMAQGDDSELTATLGFNDLSSGRAVLGDGTLQLKGEPGRILGTFSLDDRRRSLDVLLNAGANTAQVPFPNQLESADISVRASRFDAAALAPLVESALARLSGNIDAELQLLLKRVTSVEPGVPHAWESSLVGEARLSEGSAYIDSLGLEVRDISLNVVAEPESKKTKIQLHDLRGKARSQDTNLEGQGELLVDGTKLESGTVALRLRSVPITLQGLNLGKARGQALTTLERRANWNRADQWHGKEYMLVDVELIDWQMEGAITASRELIDLSDNSDIVVVQTPAEEDHDPDAMPLRFVVRIGDRTTFSLADLLIPLHGKVAVDITDESRMHGELTLRRGGRIPIFGRVFRIVKGSVRLNPEEPSNPDIDITLTARNNSDEAVFVTITGTLKDPITQPSAAELQSLLGGGAATVLGSGVQALGVNQLLGNNVQLRVNAADEEDAEASYGASIQLDEDLWFEATYQRNQDATLNQQQTESVSGTLDYRFKQDWSLRTKVGNTGGSVDLLWQYRY